MPSGWSRSERVVGVSKEVPAKCLPNGVGVKEGQTFRRKYRLNAFGWVSERKRVSPPVAKHMLASVCCVPAMLCPQTHQGTRIHTYFLQVGNVGETWNAQISTQITRQL